MSYITTKNAEEICDNYFLKCEKNKEKPTLIGVIDVLLNKEFYMTKDLYKEIILRTKGKDFLERIEHTINVVPVLAYWSHYLWLWK
ncbi:hypothetical protein ACQPUR_03280 [Clostridium neonatale]|uniref:hypothetical protein n=1 Tax=Clostridium neonatale TaxID=137838 RepID=UPI003D330D05